MASKRRVRLVHSLAVGWRMQERRMFLDEDRGEGEGKGEGKGESKGESKGENKGEGRGAGRGAGEGESKDEMEVSVRPPIGACE